VTSRVPPSSKQAGSQAAQQTPQSQQPPESAQGPQAGRRSTRAPSPEKPRPIKTGNEPAEPPSTEALLWGGVDIDRSLEMSVKEVEARLAEQTSGEAESAASSKAHHEEVREGAEREGTLQDALGQGWRTLKEKLGAAQPQRKTVPAKEGGKAASSRGAKLSAAGQAQLLQGAMAHIERVPDAFALLREAQEKGVLFVEDALRDGHDEEQEDPELAAAVEECIRRCFGVRGILRIGAGRNDRAEPIVVVVANHGFTQASLAKVPEKVNRFATLLAIPYDLLPLRRDR
jgi:hypothetical protein